MTYQQVFDYIQKQGGDRAVVCFSGGHDEGGVDSIRLFKEDKELKNLSSLIGKEKPIEKALCEPIESQFYGFDGEREVKGDLVWDCKTRKVKMVWDQTSITWKTHEMVFQEQNNHY